MRSGRLDVIALASLINAKQSDESGADGPRIFFRSPYEVRDHEVLVLVVAVGKRERNAVYRQADQR
ncbi:hypothetical protein IFHNHDMJ_03260 [Synechococcus sp. CBW1107]|nr:hypothetical protein IFHNHDMJ_03260 [Synechococcus sp. CBW1107]